MAVFKNYTISKRSIMLQLAPIKLIAKLVFNSRGANLGELLHLALMGIVHRWLQGGEDPHC